ncbi:ABC transporter substrate-binding protein, partial [Candidatus Parcubacteria bacterium]|nr:ABC transporter substrate-binding protein [Candidatus Parcubacteria bacterium]
VQNLMTKNTKIILGIIIVVVVIGGIWLGVDRNADPVAEEKKAIKIGVILPITGPVASQGESAKDAIEMAIEKQNFLGGIGGKKIELIIEDTGLSSEKAVSSINKLLYNNQIKFILGPLPTGEIAAVAPIISKGNALMINFGGGSSPHSQYGNNAFTSSATFATEVPTMIKYMENMGYKKVAFLGVNTDSVVAVENTLKNSSINLIKSELIDISNKDFKTIFLKLKELKPDAIYILHYPSFMSIILKERKELGIDTPILTFANFEDPSIQIAGTEILNGIAYTTPIKTKTGKQFFIEYEIKYGKKPVVFADNAYDATNLLLKAIEIEKGDVDKIREYLKNIKNYDGAGGVFSIDKNRDAKRDYVVKIYQENE